MTTSPQSFPSGGMQGHGISNWARSLSPRRIGSLVLLLALLLTIVNYLLQAKLNYPAILLDKASLAHALVAQGEMAILFDFVALGLGSGLFVVISLGLSSNLEEKRRRWFILTGGTTGLLWMLSALLGLVLVPLWRSTPTAVTQIPAMILFMLTEVAIPLLLLFWTTTLVRQFRVHRVYGVLGLFLVLLRSLIWGLNALLPITLGFYEAAGIVNTFAVLGTSLWLVWLLLFGFRLVSRREEVVGTAQMQNADGKEPDHDRIKRRGFLKFGANLGIGIVSGAFAVTYTGLAVISAPTLEGDDVPSEPSLIGTLFYLLLQIYLKLNPITTVAQERAQAQNAAPQPLPAGVSLENVNASRVPAQIIRAPGAVSSRAILHIHGGGWAVPFSDQDRVADASLSQATGAWVLLPDYRLAPEHPFPAGLSDCVTAYRWLRGQGIAASQIVIIGGSAGGNLALATVAALRESGDALPAALITESAPTDLAMTGETYTTKAGVDPILGSGLAKNSYVAYTNNSATDPHNPLVSPLYADVHGFPPTLLQVGTQEVLLSDSTRMADRLKAAGVEVKLEIWPGMFHGWRGQSVLPESQLATEHIVKFIRQYLRV